MQHRRPGIFQTLIGRIASIESLEERRMFAVTVFEGRLIVQGDDTDNAISLALDSQDRNTLVINDDGIQHVYDVRQLTLDVSSIYMIGNGGNDLIAVKQGSGAIPLSLFFNGDEGDDTLIGSVGPDRLSGGDGNDSIIGRAGIDILSGGNGDDILDGGAGGDVLHGNDDDDALIGGSGEDSLFGDLGDDLIDGGDNDDSISGSDGADTIDGGGGRDSVSGGIDNDFIDGGFGNDTLDGSTGDDEISGGQGRDKINGGRGNDILDGGIGDDQIDGAEGFDQVFSGDGADVVYRSPGFSQAELVDFEIGLDELTRGSLKLIQNRPINSFL